MQLFRLTLAAVLMADLAFPAPARAQVSREGREFVIEVRNAGELAALCAAKPSDLHYAAKENFCHGFAQGVVSAELERVRAAGAGATRAFCITGDPTRRTTLTEFVRWTDARPGEKNGAPFATLMKFLTQRFPCSTTPRPAVGAPATPAPAR
ncbi:MAG: hypothetical protein EXR01_02465 [Acetobacteraceae bacterium]|nr:hypothetical protein [Acetobacteraceae bacterium]